MAATSYPNSTDQMTYQEDQKEATLVSKAYKKFAKYLLTRKSAHRRSNAGRK
jgi:hypothetical protein